MISPQTTLGLLTDLYQLTMGYGYFRSGKHETQAVFHYFYRRNPFKGAYCIAAGLETFLEYLNQFSFSKDDVEYLRTLTGNDDLPLFDESYLNYLQNLKFTASVDAVPEGTVVFPHEPMVRIQGPMIQCQLIETALLNIMNFQTLIATKASRMNHVAEGAPIYEFGLRRAQGINGGLAATRAAYIGGCAGTSNVLAAKLLKIPAKGTHAHSWVMSFPSEEEAFDTYAEHLPNNCVFLVDTYDTLNGVKKAIESAKKLKAKGYSMIGIRLDSGNLAELSKNARALLDEAGMRDASIVASNDLDEYKIQSLKSEGARIDVWGLGTRLVTAFDEPALGGVYKISAIEERPSQWSYKIKVSEDKIKISNPGFLQIKRYTENNQWLFDVLVDENTPGSIESHIDLATEEETSHQSPSIKNAKVETLLKPILKDGNLVSVLPSINEIQQHARNQLNLLPAEMKRIDSKQKYTHSVKLSKSLYLHKESLLAKIRTSAASS